jgi:hypothetical protein
MTLAIPYVRELYRTNWEETSHYTPSSDGYGTCRIQNVCELCTPRTASSPRYLPISQNSCLLSQVCIPWLVAVQLELQIAGHIHKVGFHWFVRSLEETYSTLHRKICLHSNSTSTSKDYRLTLLLLSHKIQGRADNCDI